MPPYGYPPLRQGMGGMYRGLPPPPQYPRQLFGNRHHLPSQNQAQFSSPPRYYGARMGMPPTPLFDEPAQVI